MAMNIMIQGTMSNAGKSLLAAGLCRVLKQDGYRVAPFKSQNMALNSFITKDGGEMGRAQVVQAEAAGIEPDTRMNPILLKPTTDVGSQVIINGQVRGNMQAMEYFRRKRDYIPAVLEAYNSLNSEYDVIVIEGAGSPAEINLKQEDIVNMGLAKLDQAGVALADDGGHGLGVAAQLGQRREKRLPPLGIPLGAIHIDVAPRPFDIHQIHRVRRKDGDVDFEHLLTLAHLEVVEDQPAIGQMIPKKADGLAFRFVRGLPDGYDLRH